MNKRPTVQQIRNLKSRLADAKADKAMLYKALDDLWTAMNMTNGPKDAVLPAYDATRAVLQKLAV